MRYFCTAPTTDYGDGFPDLLGIPLEVPERLRRHTGAKYPEMFRTGRGNMAPSRHTQGRSAQPLAQPQQSPITPPQAIPSLAGDEGLELRPHPPLTILDLRSVADDIKETLASAISELRLDLK